MNTKLHILFTILAVTFTCSSIFTQVSTTEFGKNRVQYHDDFEEWQQYESRNFITYFYGKSRPIAEAAVMLAEYHHDEIQKLLEHRINDKIEIIVYLDVTDLKQSNIGNEDAFTNTGGHTKIVGNKIFVYYNGNMSDMQQDIRQGIALVYFKSMMFGSNLQEIVQNAVLLHLPEWYEKGIISYAGTYWSTELDAQLREVFLGSEFESFATFSEANPSLAGHSMWYYVGQQYGNSTISDLLYLTSIKRSVELGFAHGLGVPYRRLVNNWEQYFRQRYESEARNTDSLTTEPIAIKNRKELPITAVALSPDGSKIAFATNQIGRVKVFVYDMNTGKQERIFSNGFRNAFQSTDYNYPLLAWKPDGQTLGIMYERRDKIKLRLYNVLNGDKEESLIPERYERIYNMDFFNNNQLAFSATANGYSDIFLYRVNTRQSTQLTNDYHSDLDVSVVHVDSIPGILFSSNRESASLPSSNRLDTTLPVGDYDIFHLSVVPGEQPVLLQITNTETADERNPAAIDSTWFSYVSDKSGINNRLYAYIETYLSHYEQYVYLNDGSYLVLHADTTLEKLDSSTIDSISLKPVYKKRGISKNTTNLRYGIDIQHSAPRVSKLLQLTKIDGKQQLFLLNTNVEDTKEANTSNYRSELDKLIPKKNVEAEKEIDKPAPKEKKQEAPPANIPKQDTLPPAKLDTGKVDIENYFFQSEFEDEDDDLFEQKEQDEVQQELEDKLISLQRLEEAALKPDKRNTAKAERFIPSRITPYRLSFRMDYFSTQLDNGLLFDGLDGYSGIRNEFDFIPAGVLLKANFKDLLEDHELEGGVRVPLSFNGTEFFVVYDNKKKRLDKRYALYRRSLRQSEDLNTPVDPLLRLRETTVLGMYQLRYPFDIFRSIRATLTARHDETTQLATSLTSLEEPTLRQQRLGLRLAYVFDNTLHKDVNLLNGTRYRISVEAVKRFKIDFGSGGESFEVGNGIMGVVGVDARHYQPILKHSVLAVRFAGETTFGAERILYYLGGTDNWLFPSFNETVNFPPQGDFAYQALAASMRGFQQNIRNGTSYMLTNLELRIPVVKYIDKRTQSKFFRHLQLVAFFDAGTAWEGNTPFAEDNPLNTRTFNRGASLANPKVSVTVNYFRDPVVMSYGAGVRTMLFGYFVRADYAWGIESGNVLEPRIHLSLGTDF